MDIAKKVGNVFADEAQEAAFKKLEDPATQAYAAGIIANSTGGADSKLRMIAALRGVADKAEQLLRFRTAPPAPAAPAPMGSTRRHRRRRM
jgi:hypothetical protein